MKLRAATDNDLVNIADLAQKNELLLEGLDTSQFQRMMHWLYVEPPRGERLQIVGDDEGRILAHYGAVPFEMKCGNDRVMAALASNLVIDKETRKQSPFFTLQSQFAKEYPKLGYSFAYGVITRQGVLEPHLRMGWKKVGDLFVYVRPICFTSVFGKIVANRFLQSVAKLPLLLVEYLLNRVTIFRNTNVQIEKILKFDESFSEFLAQWTKSQQMTAVRSVEILNWRYAAFKERGYQIYAARKNGTVTGYMILRAMPMKQFSSVALVDLIAFENDKVTVSSLLSECLNFAHQINADVVATVAPLDHPFRNGLFKKGFIRTSEKFTLVTHSPKKNSIDVTGKTFPKWFVNWFDHDFV